MEQIEAIETKLSLLDLYDNFIHNPLPNLLTEDDVIRFSSKGKWIRQENESYTLICKKQWELRYRVSEKGKFYFNICPFHNSQYETYDFMIDPKTDRFRCYGCCKEGSILDFIKDAYPITTLEAIQVMKQIVSFKNSSTVLKASDSYSPKITAIAKHLSVRENSSTYFAYAHRRISELNVRVDNYLHFLSHQNKLYPLTNEKIDKIANRLCVNRQLVKKHLGNF